MMLVSKKYSNGISGTLFEHMEGKDLDLQEPDHDDYCLKLLDEKILKKIFLDKVLKKELVDEKYKSEKEFVKLKHDRSENYRYEVKTDDYSQSYNFTVENILKNPIIYHKSDIEIVDSKIGHVVVKRGYNGFSQRLGFVDVFIKIKFNEFWDIEDDGKTHNIQYHEKYYVMFFKIKTSRPSISIVSREIEFFRDALKEIEKVDVTPFYVGHSKLPLKQFESITFDEILQMEKEIK